MRHLSPLSLVIVITLCLFSAHRAASADEGTITMGILAEYSDLHDLDGGDDWTGTAPGLTLGYENTWRNHWYSLDARYTYGRLTSADDDARMDMATLRTRAVMGYAWDVSGIAFKPYVGLAFNWEGQDLKDESNVYSSEYALPIGARVEKALESGLLGMEVEYQYLLRREVHITTGDNTWGARNFDGSYNLKTSVYYEPAALPVGFEPYYRFSSYEPSKYWDTLEVNQVGLEMYMKF